jgi:membrane fusion protein, multidrug efflux system
MKAHRHPARPTVHRYRPARRIAGAVILCLLLVGCHQPAANPSPSPPSPVVTVSQPMQREVVEWDEYTGRLEAVETVEVRARVGGYLEKVHFKDGAKVQKGDLLLIIDPRPYRAELDRAQGKLARARAQLDLAKNDLVRAERLFQRRVISEQEFDTRAKNVREAEAIVQSAQAAVDMAKLNLEFTEVRAPISGRISRRLVAEGNLVNDGTGTATLLTTIVSINPIYVYVDADERSVLKYRQLAREGKRVSASDQPIPADLALANEEGYPHKGMIDFVDNRVDPGTGTLRVRGVFPNPDGDLIPGFFARLRVPGSGQYQALLVPDRALAMNQGQKYVLVVNGENTVEYRPVKPGPVVDGLRVIAEGLKVDDWVLVEGIQRVRPGVQVTPEQAVGPGVSPKESVAITSTPAGAEESRHALR